MNRRESVLALIAFGAASAPLPALAQAPRLKRVGISIIGSTAAKIPQSVLLRADRVIE